MKLAAAALSVAFTVASAGVFAQGATDPVAQLRACSLLQPEERLKCLNDLSQTIAPPARPRAEVNSWIVSETTSPVDYTPIVTAKKTASDGDSSIQLSIFCRNGRTELVASGPTVTLRGEEYTISYRINGAQPVQLAARSPSFGTGAAFQGDVVFLLQSLPEQGDLAIHLSSRTTAALESSFSLEGFKVVRDKIASSCKWSRAIASPSR